MKIKIGILALAGLMILMSCKDTKKSPLTQNSINLENMNFDENGEKIIISAAKTLKTGLTEAVAKGGFQNGINVCSKVAQKLTDSISLANDIKMRRTSLKTRNQLNTPDEMEKTILAEIEKTYKSGGNLKGNSLQFPDGNTKVIKPIFIEKLCLNCHGDPIKDIKEDVYKLIKERYPDDFAVGYKDGDLRGMWVIDKKK